MKLPRLLSQIFFSIIPLGPAHALAQRFSECSRSYRNAPPSGWLACKSSALTSHRHILADKLHSITERLLHPCACCQHIIIYQQRATTIGHYRSFRVTPCMSRVDSCAITALAIHAKERMQVLFPSPSRVVNQVLRLMSHHVRDEAGLKLVPDTEPELSSLTQGLLATQNA